MGTVLINNRTQKYCVVGFQRDCKAMKETPGLKRRKFLKASLLTGTLYTVNFNFIPMRAKGERKMAYSAKDYPKLIGMKGFSTTLLENHFKLYQGYVKNTNKVLDLLEEMLKNDKAGSYEYGELKRRLGWEFNGMRLHELYFDCLGGNGELDAKSNLAKKIADDFGSVETWKKDFIAVGAMRGIGWAVLYFDTESGKLINFWINEHDAGHPSGCSPLLVMDVFEHAFMLDYGLNRPDYINAFFSNINWDAVSSRLT